MKTGIFKLKLLSKVCLIAALTFIYLIPVSAIAQSCANYTTQRNTGIAYVSVASTANAIASWRGQVSNLNDNNRSYPVPLGFDFWYLGTRYTTVQVNINGFIDFSSSSYDGNWPANDASAQPPGYAKCGSNISYGDDGNAFYTIPCGSGSSPNSYDGTYWALAPMYGDLVCNSSSSLANSIKYKTTGTAPNRIFTVEYVNMDDKTASGSDYNFQVKLYESTGVIKFYYGNMSTAAAVPIPYSCGINGNIQTNPPALSELLTQQGDNSATFGNANPGMHFATPTSNSKITFTPPVPANPVSALTFSSVTNTSMTLNWTDWASNEYGYLIYMSTDGINYSFYNQTTANATSYNSSNLLSNTNYYWKVYAVTEGCLSSPCSAMQPTLPALTFTSVATGNWGSGSTWDLGIVPSSGDQVTIADGHTVTINGSYSCNNLTIGQGISGKLLIGSSTSSVTVTILGDIKVKGGAVLKANNFFAATHTLYVSGNISNNGYLNMRPVSTSLCQVIFNKNGNQTISGTGGTNNYYRITLQMGNSANNTLEVKSTTFNSASNFLILQNGTFKFSVPTTAETMDIFTSSTTVSGTSGIWMNSLNSILNINSTVNYQGFLTCSNGVINIGDNANESLMSNGADISLTGGTINIAGRLDRSSLVAITKLSITGGILNLNTIGSTVAGSAPFTMDTKGSSFTMTGGKIVIQQAGAGGLGYYHINSSPYNVTGGTLQIGNTSTPVSQTIQLFTDLPVYNLLLNTTNGPVTQLMRSLTVSNNIDVNTTAVLACNTYDLYIGGTLTNDGVLTTGNNTVTFNGIVPQQITGSSNTLLLNNMNINNAAGNVSLNYGGNITVNNTLSFTNGKIILNANNLIINGGNAIAGFNNNRYVVTNGTNSTGGYLQINNLTLSRDFPIGSSTSSYSPVLNFVNTGVADNFSARVFSGVYQSGTSGSTIINSVVNKTWLLNETVTGGSLVDMKLQWDSLDELGGFNRSVAGISHYDNSLSTWDTPPAWGAASPNPVPYFNMFRNGITKFPTFIVQSGNAPLPVELMYFNVMLNKQKQTEINWKTASELNNNYFTMEHSTDMIQFKNIATVKGAGNSSTCKSYFVNDPFPVGGMNYYRLSQTDFDGKTTYYPAKSIYLEKNINDFLDIRMTTMQHLELHFKNYSSGPLHITLYDLKGNRLQKIEQTQTDDQEIISVDCSGLAGGVYFLRIQNNSESFVTKFVKNQISE